MSPDNDQTDDSPDPVSRRDVLAAGAMIGLSSTPGLLGLGDDNPELGFFDTHWIANNGEKLTIDPPVLDFLAGLDAKETQEGVEVALDPAAVGGGAWQDTDDDGVPELQSDTADGQGGDITNLGSVGTDEGYLGGGLMDPQYSKSNLRTVSESAPLNRLHYLDCNAGKPDANPIITPGASGAWDEDKVLSRQVWIRPDGTWVMYYGGYDSNGNSAIGRATSTDGISWTKDGNNPIFSATGVSGGPLSIIKEGGMWRMWYSTDGSEIGYATSSDGLSWSVHTSPVLTTGGSGSFDEQQAFQPSVLRTAPDDYKMWYVAKDANNNRTFGLATSSDGVNWSKSGSNPVFSPGSDPWESSDVIAPMVYFTGQQYLMIYAAKDANTNRSNLGVAVSQDGINWVRKSDGRPCLTVSQPWERDSTAIHKAEVEPGGLVVDNGEIYIYYHAYVGNPDATGVAKLTSEKNYFTTSTWDDFERESFGAMPSPVAELSGYSIAGRPEWTVESGSPTVSNGTLSLPAGDTTVQTIRIPHSQNVGRWKFTFTINASVSTGGMYLGLRDNGSDRLRLQLGGSYYGILEREGNTKIIDTSWTPDTNQHTIEMTRDMADGYELFFDGASDGTATDSSVQVWDELILKNAYDASVDVSYVGAHR